MKLEKLKKSLILIVPILLLSACTVPEFVEKYNRLRSQIYLTPSQYRLVFPLNDERMYELQLLKEPFTQGFGMYHIESITLKSTAPTLIDLIKNKSFFTSYPINGFKSSDLRRVIYLKQKALVSFSALDRGFHFNGKYLLDLNGTTLNIKYLGSFNENEDLFMDSER